MLRYVCVVGQLTGEKSKQVYKSIIVLRCALRFDVTLWNLGRICFYVKFFFSVGCGYVDSNYFIKVGCST